MSRITPRLVTLAALVLFGCGTNNSSSKPSGDPDAAVGNPHADAPTTSGSVAPRAGAWRYSDTPVSDTCPSNTPLGEAGTFVIDSLTPSAFRIVPGDGTAAFPCSYDATGFTCPDRLQHVEDLRPSVDAVIDVHATATGSFSSATHGTGNQSATATCTGTQCNLLGANAFPCMAKVQFMIDAS